jgi:type I restriction enzyme S subunit
MSYSTDSAGWKSGRIGDLPIGIIDGDRSGKYPKRSEFRTGGHLFLNTTNIIEDRLDLSGANYVSEEKYAQITKGRLERLDIVMTTRGSIGKVALFNLPMHGLINAQMLILRADGVTLNHAFLFHLVRSDDFQRTLRNFSSGSAQPQIPITDLRSVEIRYPRISIQREIASILSAYDDLIENNTHRITILEEMAKMIYREWFVHFRFPGHERVKLVKSDTGAIPEGWSIRKVAEAVEVDPATKVPKEGMKPFVSMSSLSQTSMLITDIEERAGNSGSKFRNGDTLFARITPCLENGKTGFVQFLPDSEAVGFGSTEFIVLRSRMVNPEYVYLMARSEEFRGNAIKSMSGATGRQRVQEQCFDRFFIAHPPLDLLQAFQAAVTPMFRLIYALSLKNGNLRTTRDFLLPKLISGEVSVEQFEAEAIAQGV